MPQLIRYFRCFGPQLTTEWQVFWFLSSILFCVVALFYVQPRTRVSRLRAFACACAASYFLFIVIFTVFLRPTAETYRFNLTPFWSYELLLAGRKGYRWAVIFNVALFYPLGFLLSYALGKERVKTALLFGFACSVSIELLQLILKKGLCETDDVIHNTLGFTLGLVSFRIFLAIAKFINKKCGINFESP